MGCAQAACHSWQARAWSLCADGQSGQACAPCNSAVASVRTVSVRVASPAPARCGCAPRQDPDQPEPLELLDAPFGDAHAKRRALRPLDTRYPSCRSARARPAHGVIGGAGRRLEEARERRHHAAPVQLAASGPSAVRAARAQSASPSNRSIAAASAAASPGGTARPVPRCGPAARNVAVGADDRQPRPEVVEHAACGRRSASRGARGAC